MATKTLRYGASGGTLSFRDGENTKRRVAGGEIFEVDEATASILLEDPLVEEFDGEDLPHGKSVAAAPATPAAPTKAELQARASELGLSLPKKATVPELTAAIAAEEARLAEEAAAAAKAAADASSSGEGDEGGDGSGDAGETTETAGAGVITLGDLPDGAKKGGS